MTVHIAIYCWADIPANLRCSLLPAFRIFLFSIYAFRRKPVELLPGPPVMLFFAGPICPLMNREPEHPNLPQASQGAYLGIRCDLPRCNRLAMLPTLTTLAGLLNISKWILDPNSLTGLYQVSSGSICWIACCLASLRASFLHCASTWSTNSSSFCHLFCM